MFGLYDSFTNIDRATVGIWNVHCAATCLFVVQQRGGPYSRYQAQTRCQLPVS